MSRELTRKRRSEELLSILETVAVDDARVCRDASRALDLTRDKLEMLQQLDDTELKKQGWTRREIETACEARKPRSEAAYAIQLAHERTGMRIRQAVERGGMTVNVANIVMPAPAPPMTDEQRRKAPVIDVNPEDK